MRAKRYFPAWLHGFISYVVDTWIEKKKTNNKVIVVQELFNVLTKDL